MCIRDRYEGEFSMILGKSKRKRKSLLLALIILSQPSFADSLTLLDIARVESTQKIEPLIREHRYGAVLSSLGLNKCSSKDDAIRLAYRGKTANAFSRQLSQ